MPLRKVTDEEKNATSNYFLFKSQFFNMNEK